jgi:hypothetical protein
MKILVEKSQIKQMKEKKIMFFYWKNFFSDVQYGNGTGSRTHMKAIRGTIWKNLGSKY